jgi:hypothetical protein
MRQTGMPLFPADLNLNAKQVSDAFVCARDIRDKFLSCSMIWDLGLMDEFASWLESFN